MRPLMWSSLLFGLVSPAWASQVVSGTYTKISYNSNSSWNNAGSGLQVYLGSRWVDFSYGVSRWQYHAATWRKGPSSYSYYAYGYGSNWSVTSETNTSTSTEAEATYAITASDLSITRTETWDMAGRTILVWYTVKNNASSALTDLRLMFGVDADMDYSSYGVYYTKNDTVDVDGDGTKEWVQSAGPYSGYTIGFGACDPASDSVGHSSQSSSTTITYTDYAGGNGYYSQHWRHTISSLAAGASDDFGFVIVVDSTASAAQATWDADGQILCGNCADADGDGYYDDACGGDDCDDTDADSYPGATEYCDDADNDCDGSVDNDPVDETDWYDDDDGDGYGDVDTTVAVTACDAPEGYVEDHSDCLDSDSEINPGADEVCDGDDNDCNGTADESTASDAATWYRDADGDGYGNSASSKLSCSLPTGYVANSTDCADSASSVHPGAPESCDGLDNDCDGDIDEGEATDGEVYYRDLDGDSYGDPYSTKIACSLPSGYSTDNDDCDDSDDNISPAADERCNGTDDDCDGSVDEGSPVDGATFYRDLDSDGYGDDEDTTSSCSLPSGYAVLGGDCDDRDDAISPAADEVCNDEDDDCDGVSDEFAVDAPTWYLDLDADGYGSTRDSEEGCDQPDGYVDNTDDCDDGDEAIYPGATEIPYDGDDQDCDGEDLTDADGDGWDATFAGGEDCADNDAGINPSATEYADDVDEDCDGVIDDGTSRGDDDEDGFTEAGGDCDDGDPDIHPGAPESENGADDDCDDDVDEGTDAFDDDSDGYSENEGDCNDADAAISPVRSEKDDNGVDDDCDGVVDGGLLDPDGDGWSEDGGDCDPDDGSSWPGAPELADGVDNDCDGFVDEGTVDGDDDGDGQTEAEGDCNDADPETYLDAWETADGQDDDCDGVIDDGTEAGDDDGDGYSEYGDDCDDADAAVSPAATEVLGNGLDDDCDGTVDEGSLDLDGDGYGADDDCDDDNGWARPGLPEMCDGFDNDCDGEIDEVDCLEDTAAKDTGLVEEPTGCGCDVGGVAPGLMALVFAGALVRRRR